MSALVDDLQALLGSALGSVMGAITLEKRAGGDYDPTNGTTTPITFTPYVVLGQVDSYDDALIASGVVSTNDRRVLLSQLSLVQLGVAAPAREDRISWQGSAFTVVDVKQDPGRVYWELRATGAIVGG